VCERIRGEVRREIRGGESVLVMWEEEMGPLKKLGHVEGGEGDRNLGTRKKKGKQT
jgi:hypothetical protein